MILYPVKDINGPNIGGKASGLLKIQKIGIQVPDFLVFPTETFNEFIDFEGAEPGNRLLQFLPNLRDQEQLKKILMDWDFPVQSVIVRSSIADEDGSNDAFAGMMSSFSNLKTWEDVLEAIAKCAASAFSQDALAYRQHKKIAEVARPAVILQQHIVADVSGVVFSTYPQYPLEMAIHAVWGQGEGLVNGGLDPDEFYLSKRDGHTIYQKIASKDRQYLPSSEKGLHLIDVEEKKRDAPCLNATHLDQLYDIAQKLEISNNHPQDIEFAFTQDKLFIVQSRNITQAILPVVVYDNSNIQESYCGVTTPLTFNFAQRVYSTVYLQTMTLLSISDKVKEQYRPVLDNLLGLVKGRIYYNINNWYRGLQVLPSFQQNKEDMERMMGLEEPVDFIEDREKTLMGKLKVVPALFSNMARLLWAFTRLKTSVAQFHKHCSQYYESFYKRLDNPLIGMQIIQEREQLDSALLKNWTTPIVDDFYVMMMNGKVRRKLQMAGIINPEDFLSRYFSGNQQIESTQPALVMQELAAKAMLEADLKSLIILLPEDVHLQVSERFPWFYEQVQNFIHTYGDRTVGELKLETITMRLSPRIFYSYLRNYLTTGNTFKKQAHASLHESANAELETHLKNKSYLFRKKLHSGLNKLQKAVQYREGMRLERTRLFGMYRTIYLAAGALLQQKSILSSPRDIFYLTEPEIRELLEDKLIPEIADLITSRKATFEQYKTEEVPARVIEPPLRDLTEKVTQHDPYRLQGTGCVPGEVSAEVIIIKGPEDDLDVSGKIVCALRTDPGWVALFPTCKGVLIEKGSALSHSVILLREFGIPAIINISGLTTKLRSGQKITMNGGTGEIKILEDGTN